MKRKKATLFDEKRIGKRKKVRGVTKIGKIKKKTGKHVKLKNINGERVEGVLMYLDKATGSYKILVGPREGERKLVSGKVRID